MSSFASAASPETQVLLEKLRVEQRRIQLGAQNAGSSSPYDRTPLHQQDPYKESHLSESRDANNYINNNYYYNSSNQYQQNQPSPTNNNNSPSPNSHRNNNNNASSRRVDALSPTTRTETQLRAEVADLQERVHSLENSLQYERERHAQTRELLRIALKPPPEGQEIQQQQWMDEHTRNRLLREGPDPNSITFLSHQGGGGEMNSPHNNNIHGDQQQHFFPVGNQAVLGAGNPSGELATYDRYEVYGTVAPSRITQMIYDKAHSVDFNATNSKQVLVQHQQGMSFSPSQQQQQQHEQQQQQQQQLFSSPSNFNTVVTGPANHSNHQQNNVAMEMHHPQAAVAAGGGGGNNLTTTPRVMNMLLPAASSASSPVSQQQQQVRRNSPPRSNNIIRSSQGTPSRRNSFRAGTPTPAARPFGIGERRFAPVNVVGNTASYVSRYDQKVSALEHRGPGEKRGGNKTPIRSRSPATTLRSPASQVMMNSYGGFS